MKISTHHPTSCIDAWRASSRLVATPLDGTGQREIQDGGKQNGGSSCYLKVTSFAEIVRVADFQKVPDIPLQTLGNVLCEGEHLLSS